MELSGPERALYLISLAYAWTNGARLPADEERIRRALGYDPDEWAKHWPAVREKGWTKDGAHLVNRNLSSKYAEAFERARYGSERGRLGGKASGVSRNKIKGPRTTSSFSHEPEREREREKPSPEEADESSPRSTRQRFAPPTREEVRAFWKERKLTGDPEDFFDHFALSRWRLSGGRGAVMSDWHLAAQRWSRHDPDFRPRATEPTPQPVKKLVLAPEHRAKETA